MSDLRVRLKRETADSHNRIDHRLGQLDLTGREGLGALLKIHYLVRSLYEPLLSDTCGTFRFLAAIRSDLHILNMSLPIWRDPPVTHHFHPIGYRYVVTGSQLGARLLHREWQSATDEKVRAADHFMTANVTGRDWPDFLAELERGEWDEVTNSRIIDCANQVFNMFNRAASETGLPEDTSTILN